MLEEGIGMDSRTFVVDALSKLHSDEQSLGSRDVTNFGQVVRQFPPIALRLLHSLCAKGSPHATILSKQVDIFTTIAWEEFQ